jgi:hypothetical protein
MRVSVSPTQIAAQALAASPQAKAQPRPLAASDFESLTLKSVLSTQIAAVRPIEARPTEEPKPAAQTFASLQFNEAQSKSDFGRPARPGTHLDIRV